MRALELLNFFAALDDDGNITAMGRVPAGSSGTYSCMLSEGHSVMLLSAFKDAYSQPRVPL